jgi:GTPase SAR1 family protein
MSDLRIGIFGPSLSGKTTLAKAIARADFAATGRLSLALDPHAEDWGEGTTVTDDRAAWLAAFWASTNCNAFLDEAAATVSRDRDMMPVFTRGRHQGHRLFILGHSGADLLPGMRQQFTRLYLFRQPASAAETWAELFADPAIKACADLAQFEFLDCALYRPPIRRRLKL